MNGSPVSAFLDNRYEEAVDTTDIHSLNIERIEDRRGSETLLVLDLKRSALNLSVILPCHLFASADYRLFISIFRKRTWAITTRSHLQKE